MSVCDGPAVKSWSIRLFKVLYFVLSKITVLTKFIGTSSMALDVLTSLAVDYISNLGRTLRIYCDRHSKTMTAEVRSSYILPNFTS